MDFSSSFLEIVNTHIVVALYCGARSDFKGIKYSRLNETNIEVCKKHLLLIKSFGIQ